MTGGQMPPRRPGPDEVPALLDPGTPGDMPHYPLWRNIGYEAGADTEYEEICVCGTCVPKHSHFPSRAAVPEWPCPHAERLP